MEDDRGKPTWPSDWPDIIGGNSVPAKYAIGFYLWGTRELFASFVCFAGKSPIKIDLATLIAVAGVNEANETYGRTLHRSYPQSRDASMTSSFEPIAKLQQLTHSSGNNSFKSKNIGTVSWKLRSSLTCNSRKWLRR